MLDAPRTPGRVPARRPKDVDYYGGTDAPEPARPNVFAVLWRRRWVVVACVLLALLGGLIYNVRAPNVYSSGSVIYVQDNALKMVADPTGGQSSRSAAYQFTQCQLLTSTAIVSKAIEKPEVLRARCLQGVDNPVGVIKAGLAAVPDKFSDLISVSMESAKPEDAAVIVNAVVEAYVDYQAGQHKSTSLEVLKIFERERDGREAELAKTQAAETRMKKENPDLALMAESGSGTVSLLSKLAGELSDAQLWELKLKTASEEADLVKNDPDALRRVMDRLKLTDGQSGGDLALMAEYRQSRRNLDDLLDSLGSRNKLVQQAEKNYDRTQSQVQQASQQAATQYMALLKQERQYAEKQAADIDGKLETARKSAIDLNFKFVEFEQLRQDEARIGRALDLLDSRVKEINVNEDVGNLTVSVLEPARASVMPIRPNKGKNMGVALVAGLMGGVGLAMLRDLLDQRIRSADEIMTLLDLPILGSIPHMPGKGKPGERGRMVQGKPRSNVAESFRTVRTALSFGISQTAAKTILVTSPAPGDGKSSTASNMALAFAQSGRRTLLIDADCRRPTQDRIYELPDGPGLADVLAGEADVHAAIVAGVTEKLDVLPCGTIPHNPAELLDSQALLDLLAGLGGEYDQVVIDAPPVVPVTDARILAASCDAAVLVLRADKSTRRMAEHARDALASVGANLLGVVINDVPRGKSGYGYDYYGTGSYGYKAGTRVTGPDGATATDGLSASNGDADGVMQVGPRTIDG